MPYLLFQNNAKSTLSTAVTTNSQASLALQSGHGARFPQPKPPDYFYVTIDDGTNVEICKCIDRSTDTLTVLRGQEGTTAQSSFAIGSKVELRVTADSLDWVGDRGNLIASYVRGALGVASLQVLGQGMPTLVGTQLARTLNSSSWREGQGRIAFAGTNSAQVPSGIRHGYATVNGIFGYRFTARFGFAIQPTSHHFFIGLINTTGAVNSVHPPSSVSGGLVVGYVGSGPGAPLGIYYADSGQVAAKWEPGSYFTANTPAWYELQINQAPLDPNVWVRLKRLDISSITDVFTYFTACPRSYWLSPYLHHTTLVASHAEVDFSGWSIE